MTIGKLLSLRLTYKEVKNAPLSLEKGGLDTFSADPNFARCERFISNRDDVVFNWYYSYEGFLAHNEPKLKKNKSKPISLVPPVLFLAHEFFDALPIMIFEKIEGGWVEKLVDNSIDAQYNQDH